MANEEKSWTVAMREFLADGQVHPVEDVLKVGASNVSSERALKEMNDKQPNASEERRVATGQRNVAQQVITGWTRFGKARVSRNSEGTRVIRWLGDESQSIGELALRVEAAESKVAAMHDVLEVALAQIDYLTSKLDGDASVSAPEQAARAVYDEKVVPLVG